MLFAQYKFHCLLDRDAVLPAYKGSTFRGAFGHAFKQAVCSVRAKRCEECLLTERCLYIKVFEQSKAWNASWAKKTDHRVATPPLPYVIEPASTLQTHFKTGEPFDFNLLLFGEANEYLPYFIYAVEIMGKTGMGRKLEGRRASFHIDRVTLDDHVIYSKESPRLVTERRLQELRLDDPMPRELKNLGIHLETPLRLKFKNQLQCELPFHLLIRSALRRVSNLFAHYGAGEPDLDYRGLVKRAEDVTVHSSSLDWFDWKRYSSRQEAEMLMGGMSGSVSYEGSLSEFVPLLSLAAQLHLGKSTTFGLGKLSLVHE